MNRNVSMLEAALVYAKLGWRVFPLHTPTLNPERPCSCGKANCKKPGKHPRFEGWKEAASTDPSMIEGFWKRCPDANIGLACGQGSGIWVLDVDFRHEGFETLQGLWDEHDDWPSTVKQTTGSGSWHYLFQWQPGVPNAVGFMEGLDTRSDGGLIVLAPSLHESGNRYEWTKGFRPKTTALAPAPPWLIAAIQAEKQKPVAAGVSETVKAGSRNDRLFRDAAAMRRRGMDEEAILAALQVANRKYCEPPLEEDEVTRIASSAVRYAPAVGTAIEPRRNGSEGNYVVSVVAKKETFEAGPPKDLAPEALYGLPGAAVNAIAPCTESCPAAVLVSFLVGVGCLIGHGPHVYRDGAHHGVNEFACLVGLTGVSRKGTAGRRVEEILGAVGDLSNVSQHDILDAHVMREASLRSWRELLLPGLGSGEALVAALAANVNREECPRRLVFEEEFSKPLRIMQREGVTLSETLRAAWDGSILANITKAKALRVPKAHVSIVAHITENELRARLGATEMFNGFANRFLWICTRRAGLLPFGGGDAPVAPVVRRLREAITHARQTKRVEFDDQTKAIWDQGKVYALLCNRPQGLLGAVTSRAEVHVTRLALLYALLDAERTIRIPHIMAALAVWDYAEKSAEYLFGRSTGDDYADIILELLQDIYPGGMTRTEIRDGFRRNAAPGRIPMALNLLEKEGRAERIEVASGDAGRPAEYWRASGLTEAKEEAVSPLVQAKQFLQKTG